MKRKFKAFSTNFFSSEPIFTKWQSPSNIALVKYWGKKKKQIPTNPSISFSLSNCKTVTEVKFTPLNIKTKKPIFTFFFDSTKKPSFDKKIQLFLNLITPYFPFLTQYHLTINSSNTFPHSSGIASSASSFSALSLCLMSFEKKFYPSISDTYFYQKASFIARLGSGSACRSVFGNYTLWGKTVSKKKSKNKYAVPLNNNTIHPIFKSLQDSVLIVKKSQKSVSSSVGHKLMNRHPYRKQRKKIATKNTEKLLHILKTGKLQDFIKLVEYEALNLHALMLVSDPPFLLFEPNTLTIIERIWAFRKATNTNICFTLDAGANIHLLYPKSGGKKCINFIETELLVFCENQEYICDYIGRGPVQLNNI